MNRTEILNGDITPVTTETTYTRAGQENKVLTAQGEAQIKAVAEEAVRVLHNLRFYTKYWNEHGGYQARARMEYWQTQADKLLDSLGLTTHRNINAVKIIKL